jgi:hypothetical protein
MSRYRITQLPDRTIWVILDQEMWAYCMLPDGEGGLIPLEWKIRPAAEAWLQRCYKLWSTGAVPAPKGWGGSPALHGKASASPWDHTYYDR